MSNDRSVHKLNEWTHKADKVSKSDSVKSHYLDDDDLGNEFCERVSCDACMGCDQNGEPNGYGCGYRDAYIVKNGDRLVDYDEAYEIVNKELTQAKKDLEEAEKVIEFYADKKTWNRFDPDCGYQSKADIDSGIKARQYFQEKQEQLKGDICQEK